MLIFIHPCLCSLSINIDISTVLFNKHFINSIKASGLTAHWSHSPMELLSIKHMSHGFYTYENQLMYSPLVLLPFFLPSIARQPNSPTPQRMYSSRCTGPMTHWSYDPLVQYIAGSIVAVQLIHSNEPHSALTLICRTNDPSDYWIIALWVGHATNGPP